MIKFELLNGHYITKYDKLNWVIAKDKIVPDFNVKTGEPNAGAGETLQDIFGYYPTLETAWNGSIKHSLLSATSNKEISEILQKMKELKVTFESELKIT